MVELAESEGLHPVYLTRRFRETYGTSVSAYLRQLKVCEGARRLIAGPDTLTKIAHDLGFADQSHFCRCFQAALHMTPTEFRRLLLPYPPDDPVLQQTGLKCSIPACAQQLVSANREAQTSSKFAPPINNEGTETMNTRIVKRTYRCLAAFAALAAATASAPATAAGFGGALQPGSTVCTDWLGTEGGGIYLYAYATGGGTYTWTLRMSAAPGGAEVDIFRSVTSGFFNRQVTPPVRGKFFYRGCLEVTNRPATGYRLNVSPGVGAISPQFGVGPHMALLTPGSQACGEFAMGPTRLRGSSDRAVQWSVRGTDLDYASVGALFRVNGAMVDRSFDPGPSVSSTDACATATTAPTTVSFELLNP